MTPKIYILILLALSINGCNRNEDVNYKVPIGHDNISKQIIKADGIFTNTWRRGSVYSYVATVRRREQWLPDGTLLVRYIDGNVSPFSGGGKINHPLKYDPDLIGKNLQDCLDEKDNGEILEEYKPGEPFPVN